MTTTTTTTRDSSSLDNFQCPFEQDPETICSYYQLLPDTTEPCPFGHQSDILSTFIYTTLQPIPSYICIQHLIGQCTNPLAEPKIRESQNSQSESEPNRCSAGFHPTIDELVDLDHLHQRIASTILTLDQNSSSSNQDTSITSSIEDIRTESCGICMDQLSPSPNNNNILYGILENCPHTFCAHCIMAWHQENQSKTCPVCRVSSNRILISSQMLNSDTTTKSRFFDLQYRCFQLYSGQSIQTDDLVSNMNQLSLE